MERNNPNCPFAAAAVTAVAMMFVLCMLLVSVGGDALLAMWQRTHLTVP